MSPKSLLLDEKKSSGIYNDEFNVDQLGLKNGLYNIRITVNNNVENHKLLRVH